ncbi:hypothetical protein F5Y15DRAFT_330413 [Xylariaceae sp. FL0016]|nr:hypothetical protein F5Y15DRAFT_330413 [Xylariaceae sp. FL0016]
MFSSDGFKDFKGFSNVDDGDWSRNLNSSDGSSVFSQAAFSGNSTFSVINEFKFLAARSIRTSTIILATFNTISAAATAAGIFYDCYSTAKRNLPRGKDKVNIFTCVKGPELYPFILSLGIAIQGIVFAISQSHGLDGLFESGCSLISQFMWPAIFIVPYLQLVFGLEITFRALRTRPFPSRGKWDVAICLAVVKILLLITGLVAFFIRAPDFCFASLFWFVAKWAEGGFILLLAIAVILTICAIVIFLKLKRYSMIENSQRVTASRMVYYLVLAVVSNSFMVPFFLYLTIADLGDDDGGPGLTLSMIATVVANVTGLMTGGLHLFLRSNTISTIGPENKLAEYERQKLKHQIRMSPNDPDFDSHMLQPVAGPSALRKTESQESLVGHEKDEEAGHSQTYYNPNPLRSNAVLNPTSILRAPEPAQVPPTLSHTHGRKLSASYTLFPGKNQNTASVALLPSAAYAPNTKTNVASLYQYNDSNETLKPPPSIRPAGRRHVRNSSMASHATVQIGLRLSNVDDMPPFAPKMSMDREENLPLDWPNKPEPSLALKPSPLAKVERPESVKPPSRSQSPDSTSSSQMRISPPAPSPKAEVKKDCTLTPAVYDPNSPTKVKVPSPKGVGFNLPPRANTTPVNGSPTTPSPRARGNSAAKETRSDWI